MSRFAVVHKDRRKGAFLLESAMYLPILFLLFFGMLEIARVGYTYYAVQKLLLSVARLTGTQTGVNFCDDGDTIIESAKNLALTGTADGSGTPIITGITADQIQVRIERFEATTGDIGECECSVTGCDTANGGRGPDYLVVSIPDGVPITLRIPALPLDPILLRPSVRVPFSGT